MARAKRRIVCASFQNLNVVLCDDRLDPSLIAIVYAIHIDEVVGEPPRDDRQKQARILGSDVAKRVGNVPRTDHERPSRGRHLLVADGDLELTLQNIEDFRFMAVNMERRPMT